MELMLDKRDVTGQSQRQDAESDRVLQVLALEYTTLRAEILMRINARYQFVGFITTAAALTGVGIGYSSGFKVWLLVGPSRGGSSRWSSRLLSPAVLRHDNFRENYRNRRQDKASSCWAGHSRSS